MTRLSTFIVTLGLLGINACGPITPAPDYTIRVVPNADGSGYAAVPPQCQRWSDNGVDFTDNQPLPQFGCADARNLAMVVDRPEDLIQGRDPGPANGVPTAGTIVRYNNNQTRGLLYIAPTSDNGIDATTASTGASSLSGETPPTPSSGK